MGDNRRIKIKVTYGLGIIWSIFFLLTSCTLVETNDPSESLLPDQSIDKLSMCGNDTPEADDTPRLDGTPEADDTPWTDEIGIETDESVNREDRMMESGFSEETGSLLDEYRMDQVDTRQAIMEETFLQGVTGETFYQSGDYQKIQLEESETVIGGIIPHHLVANSFIADFYQAVSQAGDYDLIVIISPNHYTAGPRVQIGASDYYTYQGVIPIDEELIYDLTQENEEWGGLINVADESYLSIEHGQLVHMPYIKTYFPQAKVLSLMLAETRDLSDLSRLAQILYEAIGDRKTLLVGSIDFSHYLTLEEAENNDAYTRELIRTNDYETMSHLSNDYIDSPSTYGLLMLLMDKMYGETRPVIFNHSNSAKISGQLNSIETTSYFQVLYLDD